MLADVLWTTRGTGCASSRGNARGCWSLAKKSKGRPAKNLTRAERREASDLLDKLGHIEYAGNVAGIVLPFRPLSRLAAKFLESRRPRPRRTRDADAAEPGRDPYEAGSGKDVSPPRSEPKATAG